MWIKSESIILNIFWDSDETYRHFFLMKYFHGSLFRVVVILAVFSLSSTSRKLTFIYTCIFLHGKYAHCVPNVSLKVIYLLRGSTPHYRWHCVRTMEAGIITASYLKEAQFNIIIITRSSHKLQEAYLCYQIDWIYVELWEWPSCIWMWDQLF